MKYSVTSRLWQEDLHQSFAASNRKPIDMTEMAGILKRVIVLLRWITISCLFVACQANAASFTGQVVGIADGDTVSILDDSHTMIRVRLAGIDAPERRQPFGTASKVALSACAFGKTAQVEGRKKDKYGRLVAILKVDGVDCGRSQISLGMAWHYKAYSQEQPLGERLIYAAAEEQARKARRGLWVDDDPETPWAYRKDRERLSRRQ